MLFDGWFGWCRWCGANVADAQTQNERMWLHGWLPDSAETTVPRTPDSAVKINKI